MIARKERSDGEPCALKSASTVRRGEQPLPARVSALLPYSFSGEIKIARKHTRFIMRDLPGLVSGAVGQLGERWHAQAERINAYRQHELNDVQAHDLVVRALDNRAITVTQVPAILKEWRTPRHLEFAVHGKTAWRFFNAVTEAAKGSGLWALPQRTQALHGLLDGEVGLFTNN